MLNVQIISLFSSRIVTRYCTLYNLRSPDIYFLLVMVTPLVVPELVPPVQVEAAIAEQEYVLVRPNL